MLKSRNLTHVCKRLLCEMALKWYLLDLTPDCLALMTQKMNQLTVHKENFSNVVGNANDDLTVK